MFEWAFHWGIFLSIFSVLFMVLGVTLTVSLLLLARDPGMGREAAPARLRREQVISSSSGPRRVNECEPS